MSALSAISSTVLILGSGLELESELVDVVKKYVMVMLMAFWKWL